MSKKKYIPPDGEKGHQRQFRRILRQKPSVYPAQPRSNKNGLIKPIRRS